MLLIQMEKIGGVRYVSGDTGLETMSQVQKLASCSSPERSEPPVNGNCGKKIKHQLVERISD